MNKWVKTVLFVAFLALLSGCGKEDSTPSPAGATPPPTSVEVATAQLKSVEINREMVADFKAFETADIRSRVEGELLRYDFKEGGLVRQGDVLFQLDPRPYQASVTAAQARVTEARGRVTQAQARVGQVQASLNRARNQVNREQVSAELAEAKANLDSAEREVRRFKPLAEQGAVPQQRLDQVADLRDVAKSRYDLVEARLRNTGVDDRAQLDEGNANLEAARADVVTAQAAVQTALAALQSAELNLSYTTIRAPFTGTIGLLGVDPGSMVIPGQTRLATLSKNNPIYADFSIGESVYLALSQGQGFSQAPFQLLLADDQAYPLPGEFVLVDREIDEKTGTIAIRAEFPNPEQTLKPGGYGKITMQVGVLDKAIVIPQIALTSVQSLDAVYVVKEDQTVELRMVTLGERLDKDIVITEGLKVGEQVVTQGLQKIRPGAAVQVAGKAS